jgi:glutamate-ammonia-ligase adenylyltransferase
VFVYAVPEGVDASDGAKSLASSVYFMRLSQRITGALEALTGEGRLYEVDTRLRPTGSKGPTATRLDSYIQYYENDAWTWEIMALTRARLVAGSPSLMHRLEDIIHSVLTRPRDPDKLVVDVADMRIRMAKDHRGESRWDIKHRRGGMVDAEFIAQYVQLRNAAAHPEILSTNAVEVFGNLRDAGILDPDIATDLADALRFWHRIQTVLRITTSEGLEADDTPVGPRDALIKAAGVDDFPALLALMDETASLVHGYYNEFIDVPAETARAALLSKDTESPKT